VTIANAGHPAPLVLTSAGAAFVETCPGWPLGAGATSYESTTITMAPGATLFCFTDGLVERRGEDIDTGMHRLATTAGDAPATSTDALVRRTVDGLRTEDASDDVAVLAMRWSGDR
jgi:serine phosphatase RsbU (regulator of sigma subunit)